jgi:HEPN domain-containing protein
MNRTKDWIVQSRHTLGSARHLTEGGYHDGACFQSQQAAEFAIEALYISHAIEGWGRSLTHLLKGLPERIEVPEKVIRSAKRLDRHYIQTRYPNGFAKGSPKDHYTEEDAKEAIGHAVAIIEFCEANLAGPGKSAA